VSVETLALRMVSVETPLSLVEPRARAGSDRETTEGSCRATRQPPSFEVNGCRQISINENKRHCKADTSVNCCPQISINECKVHHMSRLDTVTIGVDLGKTGKLRFLIDTGAEISIVRGTKLKPEVNFEPANGISVNGIFDALLRTEGTLLLKLFTLTHESTHLFHVMGEDLGCRYDGILGRDFWKDRGATIDYCNRVITMSEVVLDFDDKPDETTESTRLLTLNSRTE